jgi:rubrerythrin
VPSEQLRPQDAFLLAASREKKSHEFYEHLAGMHPEGNVKNLLKQLAKEELAHKGKVEYLYANTAFPQTDGG